MLKVYLAGPDVFRPDAEARGRYLVDACRSFGLEGHFPLDNVAPEGLTGLELARWIYIQNVHLILECDIVMANLNFFRGGEPDSGTCWELGYAGALGKMIYGYLDGSGSLPERIFKETDLGIIFQNDKTVDKDGHLVEDFGLPVNLMLACSAKIVVGSAINCLQQISKDVRA